MAKRSALILVCALVLSFVPSSSAAVLPPFPDVMLATSPEIVSSQIHGGGGNAGAQYRRDFVELYNRGSTAVDVSTWSVQYASASGSSWQRTNLTGTIPPGGYYAVRSMGGGSCACLGTGRTKGVTS